MTSFKLKIILARLPVSQYQTGFGRSAENKF